MCRLVDISALGIRAEPLHERTLLVVAEQVTLASHKAGKVLRDENTGFSPKCKVPANENFIGRSRITLQVAWRYASVFHAVERVFLLIHLVPVAMIYVVAIAVERRTQHGRLLIAKPWVLPIVIERRNFVDPHPVGQV